MLELKLNGSIHQSYLAVKVLITKIDFAQRIFNFGSYFSDICWFWDSVPISGRVSTRFSDIDTLY